VWKLYDEEAWSAAGKKIQVVKCKACGTNVCAIATSLKTHARACPARPTSIGQLSPLLHPSSSLPAHPAARFEQRVEADQPEENTAKRKRHQTQFQCVVSRVDAAEKAILDDLLATAIFETASPFSLLDHKAFQKFLKRACPAYKIATPKEIGGKLLMSAYEGQMEKMRELVRDATAVTMMIDGATDINSRSSLNVVLCVPHPHFLETIHMKLVREQADKLYSKVIDVVARTRTWVGTAHEAETKPLAFLAFVSDSCNTMRSLRTLLDAPSSGFAFTYGCAPHALNNLIKDICASPKVSPTIKKAMVLTKALRHVGMLRKSYEEVCAKTLNTILMPILFSATRWGGSVDMLQRLIKLRIVITTLPNFIDNDDTIDYTIDANIVGIIVDVTFWNALKALVVVMEPIVAALVYLEGDSPPLSSVFAAFLTLKVHFSTVADAVWLALNWNPLEAKQFVLTRLSYQYMRIESPVHALAFRCDPYFDLMRLRVEQRLTAGFVDVGQGKLLSVARAAIGHLLRDAMAEDVDATLVDFFMYCDRAGTDAATNVFSRLPAAKPRLTWGQARVVLPRLSDLLVKVFQCPTSAAAGERNHKTSKSVLTRTRATMIASKVEMQTAVAYNAKQRDRKPIQMRENGYATFMHCLLLPPAKKVVPRVPMAEAPTAVVDDAAVVEDADGHEDDGILFEGQDLDLLLESIMETFNFSDIPDRLLFGEDNTSA